MGIKSWAARKGVVGSTARWAAKGFEWYDRQNKYYDVHDMYRVLIHSRPESRETAYLISISDDINGLLGLVVEVLSVEAGFRENSEEKQRMYIEVIEQELLRMGVPEDLIISRVQEIDERVEEYTYSFPTSMPDITQCEVEHISAISGYEIVLVKNAPTLGETRGGIRSNLKYDFVMAAINPEHSMPEYFVTLESVVTGKSFVCVMDRNGAHQNLGAVNSGYDKYAFSIDALEIIEQEFGLKKAA